MQETVNENKKESVKAEKNDKESELAKTEKKEEGDNNKDESVNENKDSDMQETVNENKKESVKVEQDDKESELAKTETKEEGENNKDEIVNENKDATETEHAKNEATEEGDNNNKDRKAKPLELLEPDPILKDRKFSCTFNEHCEEYFPTQGQLNQHLQKVHKASFPCLKCDKKYDTANGLNKHFHKQFKFTNICFHCRKGFQFPKQLTIHEGSHTDSLASKFVCPTGGCSKVFLSKQGLEAHRKIHENKEYICDLCDKPFQTELRQKQHQIGKHGDGTVAFCGRKF